MIISEGEMKPIEISTSQVCSSCELAGLCGSQWSNAGFSPAAGVYVYYAGSSKSPKVFKDFSGR